MVTNEFPIVLSTAFFDHICFHHILRDGRDLYGHINS